MSALTTPTILISATQNDSGIKDIDQFNSYKELFFTNWSNSKCSETVLVLFASLSHYKKGHPLSIRFQAYQQFWHIFCPDLIKRIVNFSERRNLITFLFDKTWSVARAQFFKMWKKIQNEEFNFANYPVYFQMWGRLSVFSKTIVDYKPKDKGLLEIKLYNPSLFFKICKVALTYSQKETHEQALSKDGRLWKGNLTLINTLMNGKNFNNESDRVLALRLLFNKISDLFKSKQITKSLIKTHNCGSWASENLEVAGIETKKPIHSRWILYPSTYVKVNQLSYNQLKKRIKSKQKAEEGDGSSTVRPEQTLEQVIAEPINPSVAQIAVVRETPRKPKNPQKLRAKKQAQDKQSSAQLIPWKPKAKKQTFCQKFKASCVIS